MLVLDRQAVDRTLLLEIHPRYPTPPPCLTDLAHLGLPLLGSSRLLAIDTLDAPLAPEHLTALFNPLTEDLDEGNELHHSTVDVFCREGVTDAEGKTAAQAIRLAGGPDLRCRAGRRFRFAVPVPLDDRQQVERLLGNPLIHRFDWHDGGVGELPSPPSPLSRCGRRGGDSMAEGICPQTGAVRNDAPPRLPQRERGLGGEGNSDHSPTHHIDLLNATDSDLLAISGKHHLALDLVEMRAIAGHFRTLGRPPTDVELQSIALTWSEHCAHKTFKAAIDFEHNGRRSRIDGLLQHCFAAPTAALARFWVRSAFVDNAGVIAFDQKYDLAFKVETHNHPAALEPFGGAHTGIGGVIRDVLAVSAEPIANTDVLCFGPPDLPGEAVPAGVFHPARTFREVVRGVADYGNNMGIPTAGGAILFHPGYTANPLVYCGTLGIAPRGAHPRDPRPGDRIVLLGGRTGRDGLHGATMSSAALDRQTVAASAVQIGAPITEKVLRDVLPRLRDERLYHAITDCGAGGLCSAVGEMGEQLGVDVELAAVPLKYEGLAPWEIWLSEAQERMILAVPGESIDRLLALCRAHDVDGALIGRFRADGLLHLTYDGRTVADITMAFLHGGRPRRTLTARWVDRDPLPASPTVPLDPTTALLRLLAHPSIASKEEVIRRYDHEVGGMSVGKALTGNAGPADAAVLRLLPDSCRGAVLAHGINPLPGDHDPYAMALLAIDEALRNLTAAGGSIDRAALLDNFCWGDVDDPDELGALVRAAQACRDAALAYRVPFISGKDSLRNTSEDTTGRHSIPRTLLISVLGVIPDVRRTVTADLQAPGSRLYLLGLTRDELGASHYHLVAGCGGGAIPHVDPCASRRTMRALTRAIRRGLVLSCHDLSEGGLAVAAAEMALAGGLGMELQLDCVPAETVSAEALLFGESAGRFLVEVAEESAEQFEAVMRRVPHGQVALTTAEARFIVRQGGEMLIDLPVEEIERVWKGGLDSSSTASCVGAGCTRPRLSDQAAAMATTASGIPHPRSERVEDTRNGLVAEARAGATRPYEWCGPQRFIPHLSPHPPRTLILTAPGINCDRETIEACRLAGADPHPVHLNQLLSGERHLHDFAMLIIPGGFSYGDHLGAGAMLAAVLHHRLGEQIEAFVASGRPILGICNGFQVLCRLGLLGDVALVPNSTGRFECRWVRLRSHPSSSLFLRDLQEIELPIAHGEGRVIVPEDQLGNIAARAPLRYRDNPNGSAADIAGVSNAAGTILGLMPHPERYLTPYHHPRRSAAPPAGLAIFRNAVRYLEES